MVTITEVKCIEKKDNFVIGILGIIASQSSNEKPQESKIMANEWVRGPIDWDHPKHGRILINLQRIMNIPCFYCEDPDNTDQNLLESFPECI